MKKTYNPKKEDYSLSLAEMSVDERSISQLSRPYITGCQCNLPNCKVCHNRINLSLDELSESKVEKMFSQLLAA